MLLKRLGFFLKYFPSFITQITTRPSRIVENRWKDRQKYRGTERHKIRDLDSIKQTNGSILLNKHSGRQINKVRDRLTERQTDRQTDRRAKKKVVMAKGRVKGN